MYEIKEAQVIKLSNKSDIYEIIKKFDNLFIPSISQRVLDLVIYSEKLYNNAEVYCVKNNNIVVGFIAFYNNDISSRISYISEIAVVENIQNNGIGRYLLELCVRESRNNGMKKIKLEVNNTNKKAQSFYKKNKFYYLGIASKKSIYMIRDIEEIIIV